MSLSLSLFLHNFLIHANHFSFSPPLSSFTQNNRHIMSPFSLSSDRSSIHRIGYTHTLTQNTIQNAYTTVLFIQYFASVLFSIAHYEFYSIFITNSTIVSSTFFFSQLFSTFVSPLPSLSSPLKYTAQFSCLH